MHCACRNARTHAYDTHTHLALDIAPRDPRKERVAAVRGLDEVVGLCARVCVCQQQQQEREGPVLCALRVGRLKQGIQRL
jgi:hypothetical protein